MVVAKSLAEHNNSFMILGSQTKEIAFMFNELLSKTENNYHIETKKNVDTTYSRKMLLLSNKLHNKFNIIKNFFQIENNTFETSDVYFNLKSAIIYTIDLMSMSLQSNSHISVKFDPCLPIEVKGDKSKFEQILSTFMELTVEMTESGEISLSTSLQSCIITEGTYLIAFDIEFEPTNPHSRTITSQMLFDSTCVQREILKADLKKREETFMSYINKFKGIPHLQIGLIRDVIYRMITLMKGTYKIKHKAEKVIFNFTLPLGRGHTIMKEKEVDPLEISISPFTSLDNGNIRYSNNDLAHNSSLNHETEPRPKSKFEKSDNVINKVKPPLSNSTKKPSRNKLNSFAHLRMKSCDKSGTNITLLNKLSKERKASKPPDTEDAGLLLSARFGNGNSSVSSQSNSDKNSKNNIKGNTRNCAKRMSKNKVKVKLKNQNRSKYSVGRKDKNSAHRSLYDDEQLEMNLSPPRRYNRGEDFILHSKTSELPSVPI